MSKVSLELNVKEAEDMIEQMSLEEKMELVRKLEKETLTLRWRQILKDIDRRLKRFPVSKKEVAKEIAAYRKEKHAKGRN